MGDATAHQLAGALSDIAAGDGATRIRDVGELAVERHAEGSVEGAPRCATVGELPGRVGHGAFYG